MARSTDVGTKLPDFLSSPDLGELVALALKGAANEHSDHPASGVLSRAYTRAAAQISAFHAASGSDGES
jgi:hypothetical protein